MIRRTINRMVVENRQNVDPFCVFFTSFFFFGEAENGNKHILKPIINHCPS